jgi:hypothetical protein
LSTPRKHIIKYKKIYRGGSRHFPKEGGGGLNKIEKQKNTTLSEQFQNPIEKS